MDNAQKAIMIGVGLFITIIIIAAVMLITGMGQDMINNSTSQISSISSSLQSQLTSSYDNTTVTGAQVITAVKRFYKDESMILVVDNSAKGGNVTEYGKITKKDSSYGTKVEGRKTVAATVANSASVTVGGLTDTTKTSSTYVPSSAKYTAQLIVIEGSDNVIGIYFTRQ